MVQEFWVLVGLESHTVLSRQWKRLNRGEDRGRGRVERVELLEVDFEDSLIGGGVARFARHLVRCVVRGNFV